MCGDKEGSESGQRDYAKRRCYGVDSGLIGMGEAKELTGVLYDVLWSGQWKYGKRRCYEGVFCLYTECPPAATHIPIIFSNTETQV